MPRKKYTNIEKYHMKRRAGLIRPRLPDSSFQTDKFLRKISDSKASCQIKDRSNSEAEISFTRSSQGVVEYPERLDIMDNCRACQNQTQKESQIFIFTSEKLPEIYRETTSLDINENDGLPKVLCRTCYDLLLEAYNFRKMCSAAALHFQQMLSVDIPEEKYTPPEHSQPEIMDELDIKTEPDSWEAPKSPLSDLSYYPASEDSLSDISDMQAIDEEFPKILITGESEKGKRKETESLGSQNEMKSKSLEVPINKKRKLVRRPCNLICSICDSKFHLKSSLDMHMRECHVELKPMEEQQGERTESSSSESQYESQDDSESDVFPERPKNEMLTFNGCNLKFNRVPSLMNRCWICELARQYFTMDPSKMPSDHDELIKFLMEQRSHCCAICLIEKPTAYELTIHMARHLKEVTENPESSSEATESESNMKPYLNSDKKCNRSTNSEDHSEHSKAHSNSNSSSSSNITKKEYVPIRL